MSKYNEYKAMLGETEVTVRYDFEPACPGYVAHPDYDAYVTIEEVCIGGVWIGSNFIDGNWCSETEDLILAEEAAMSRWEQEQEYFDGKGIPVTDDVLKTKDWRFRVEPAYDGVWLHFSTNAATMGGVMGGVTRLDPGEALTLIVLLQRALTATEEKHAA